MKQFFSCVIKRQGSLIAANLCRLHIQLLKGDAEFEILTGIGQGLQLLIRSRHLLVAITLALLPLGIRDRLREEARAVEVDVRVEEVGAESVDHAGAVLRDMRIAQMLAVTTPHPACWVVDCLLLVHHCAVLGFRQCVVVGIAWP